MLPITSHCSLTRRGSSPGTFRADNGTLAIVRRFVLRVLATAVAVLLMNELAPNLISINSSEPLVTVIVFAVILGVLNAFLRPILLLLTLPLNLLTLGLFTLVVNAIVFWLASVVEGGVQVADFGAAFLGALLVSVVSFVASRVIT
jgi:putative membrane protein